MTNPTPTPVRAAVLAAFELLHLDLLEGDIGRRLKYSIAMGVLRTDFPPGEVAADVVAFCKDMNYSPEVLHFALDLANDYFLDDSPQVAPVTVQDANRRISGGPTDIPRESAGLQIAIALQPHHPLARRHVAQGKINGTAMRQDYTGARDLLQALVDEPPNEATPRALLMLGELHMFKLLPDADRSTGLSCYRRAAELGDADAAFTLGIYFRGKHAGAKPKHRDLPLAAAYFRAAADMRHPLARIDLAILEACNDFPGAIPQRGRLQLKAAADAGNVVAADALEKLASVSA